MFKVMLVEDEPIIREGLKHYFDWESLQFHSIIEASNGVEGLSLARQEKPELIITDIRMPLMSGLDMIEQIRQELPDSLFVILTGYSDFQYAQRAINIGGITEYLVKPLQYDVSLCAIERCTTKLKARLQAKQEREWDEQEVELKQDLILKHDDDIQEDNQLFNKIEQFIIKHIDQDISLPIVAEQFYYNPSYLSRLFKQRLNKSYSIFQTEIRINYAKKRLSEPQILVTDVCKMCGYRSYKHFVKTFKNITNMTPSEYRKRLGYS